MTLSRRTLFAATAGAAVATALPVRRAVAQSAPEQTGPASRTVAYTRKIGDIEVTVLLDGYFLLEQAWVTAIEPTLIPTGLAAAALDPAAAVPLPITATLFRQGDSLTLMDAGAGDALGPTAGSLVAMLAGVGVAPEAVTRVLLGHLHPDHIGGMLTGDVPTFANATVHVNDVERAFWTDAANAASVPEAIRPWFDLAGKVISIYDAQVMPFAADADLGGGLSAVAMPGHTPGHSGFRVSSGDAQALFWGDSTAIASLQFSHPDAGIIFDTDSAQGAMTRRKVLDMAVADRLLVSGTHMPFPGFGHVAARDGAYAWEPEEWKLF